jgi:UDP-3-O-[3-hydroxymyristoyl] glucosamine N-acyltransferase
MPFSLRSLKERIPQAEIEGDEGITVAFVSSSEDSLAQSLCLAADEKQFARALQGQARAFVVPAALKNRLPPLPPEAAVLFVPNHALAHARLAEVMHGRYPGHEAKASVHPSAVISGTASLGKNVRVGPNVCIGENVKIGDDVFIGANSVIEDDAKIGIRTHIWPHVFIGRACIVGDDCHIHPNATIGSEGFGFGHDEKGQHHRIPQLGNVVIESRVEIGAGTAVDRATFGSTFIGEGTKIDNLVHIAHNVRIGRNCLLTAGFKIAGSSVVGDNVVIGGGVLVTDHVEICSGVRLAARSGVNNNITAPGEYGGHPLQPLRDYLKTTVTLAHLTEMRKTLKKLENKIFPPTDKA